MEDTRGAPAEELFGNLSPRACGSLAEKFAALAEVEHLEAVALARRCELVLSIAEDVGKLPSKDVFGFTPRRRALLELEPALGVSAYGAREALELAERLVLWYPRLGALLAKGAITVKTAKHVHAALKQVPDHLREELDEWLEAKAPWWRLHSEGKVKGLIDAQVIRLDAAWAKEQREEKEAKRGLFFKPIGAGMARMTAILPLMQAAAVKDALDQIAGTTCAKDPREPWVRRKDALIAVVATAVAEHHQLRCECGNEACEGVRRPSPAPKPLTLVIQLPALPGPQTPHPRDPAPRPRRRRRPPRLARRIPHRPRPRQKNRRHSVADHVQREPRAVHPHCERRHPREHQRQALPRTRMP